MLFQTTEEFTNYVSISRNIDFTKDLAPHISSAEMDILIPILGADFYKELDDAYNASPRSLSTEIADLIPMVQRPLAYYTLWIASPFWNVKVGDIGFQETRSSEGSSSSASQWRVAGITQASVKSADRAMDNLLKYLEVHKSDFTTWEQSSEYTATKSDFINSADQYPFNLIGGSRRTWIRLRGFLPMAEDLYIRPRLGDALFYDIKSKLVNGGATSHDQNLIKMIQKALAYLMLKDAIPSLTLDLSNPTSIQVTTDFSVNQMTASAAQNAIDKLQAQYDAFGDKYSAQINEYLDNNSIHFPLYQSSKFYKPINPSYEFPDNANRSSFFV